MPRIKELIGAHGFSALIVSIILIASYTPTHDRIQETHVEGSEPQLTLFDTGPESLSIARNIAAMKVPVERISRLILSHWHSDHSGGILSFLRIRQSSPNLDRSKPCVVDLHPDRPIARGIAPAGVQHVIGQLATDPRFEEIEGLGGLVEKHAEGHTVADETVYVSGEIPRVTPWEQGLLGAVRWIGDEGSRKGEWVSEEVSSSPLTDNPHLN